MTSQLRIPGRDNRLPLLPLAGFVNNHPKVTFHLSSEIPSRIVEHTAPGAEALVADNDDRAELVAARDELQEEIGSLPVDWTDVGRKGAKWTGYYTGSVSRSRPPKPDVRVAAHSAFPPASTIS